MNPKVIFSACLVLTTLSTCRGRATPEEPGKYQVSKSTYDDGKYRPVKRNEGRYLHMVAPYVHSHDNRELGQYRHIPVPYNGGYGPYAGLLNPYRHDGSGLYDGSKYTTTSTTTKRPTTTTTTTTTTVRPRLFNYHDEGGWRILRQEEEKKKHKYDFLYHTENGIYGEEKAHLRKGAGTAASGYYEYTGDDGELYRVNYKSDERGFIPEADHIPTPPPIPDAIKRALEYTAKKKEIHGTVQTGQYEHKPGPVRLQNMPTNDRPLNDIRPVPAYQPKLVAPLPTAGAAPQPRFLQYNAGNQYEPLPTSLGSVVAQQPQEQQQPLEQQPQPQEQPQGQPQGQPQEQPQVYESQSVAPYEGEQMQGDQPYEDAPVEQPPQQEPLPQEEPLPQQDNQPQQDQSSDLAAYEVHEEEPQASEQHNEFQPPYQVPEQLTNEDNFEYATA